LHNSKIIWRIDDRLIHGQVIIGWCGQLAISNLIVCDDEIATIDWEKQILLMAAPSNFNTQVLTINETKEKYKTWLSQNKKTFVLLNSPFVLERLISEELNIKKVNVGGIHFRDDRKEFLPYLYLSSEEIKSFKKLMEYGIFFECQDLPTSSAYNLQSIIKKKNDKNYY
jgi:PTS system mannose-specific IIB component